MRIEKTHLNMLLIALLSLSIVSCSKKDSVATVNGQGIESVAFEAYLTLKRLKPKDETQKQKYLDQYLEREALAAVIEKQKVLDKTLSDAEINEFRKEMLISRYFEKWLADQVSDEAVTNYYNTHINEYQNNRVKVAHILIRVNANMAETERKAKLTTAQEAYSKIKAGLAFEEAAKTYSEDKVSGKKGGDLGWLTEGAIDKRFSEKVFALKEGEITEPFETNFGFHIVKHIEGPVVVKQAFESLKGRIRHQLRTEAKNAEMQRLLAEVNINKAQTKSQ